MDSPRLQAVVHCPACNATVPYATAEEADKRADKHTEVTRHPTAVRAEAVTPEAENAIVARAVATCHAEHEVSFTGDGVFPHLVCSLPEDGGAVHYDPVDGVFWIATARGMTREQAALFAARIREALAA